MSFVQKMLSIVLLLSAVGSFMVLYKKSNGGSTKDKLMLKIFLEKQDVRTVRSFLCYLRIS